MKIDLHLHTREHSPCAHSTTDAMIRAAIRSGLDAVAITDHNHLVAPEHLSYLNAKYEPFRIFGGVEVTTRSEDILVLGVDDEEIEHRRWSYPDLHAFVVEREGFLAVAHPFRFDPRQILLDVDRFPPHALEMTSRNTPESAAPHIAVVAASLGVPVLSNSDAHRSCDVGGYYNLLHREPADGEELVRMLKEGAFETVAP